MSDYSRWVPRLGPDLVKTSWCDPSLESLLSLLSLWRKKRHCLTGVGVVGPRQLLVDVELEDPLRNRKLITPSTLVPLTLRGRLSCQDPGSGSRLPFCLPLIIVIRPMTVVSSANLMTSLELWATVVPEH